MLSPSSRPPTIKVAIYRSSSIGDVVLATACINLLTNSDLNAEISWIGRQPALELITKAFPQITTVDVAHQDMATGRTQVLNSIKDAHLIIDLQKSIKSQYICKALAKKTGARLYTWSRQSWLRNQLIFQARLRGRSASLPEKAKKPELFKYQMMLAPLRKGLERQLPEEMRDGLSADFKPVLPTQHDQQSRPWQKELKFGRWLAVAPGASFPTKKAPVETFEELLGKIKSIARKHQEASSGQEPGVGLLFLGDEKDRATASQLIDRLDWPHGVLNLAGKLSLWESALALRDAKALIANDTSLGHIAEAVGVPATVLFGPTVEGFGFAPHMQSSRAFSVDLGCRPCSKHGKKPCRFGDHLCFKQIPLDEVAKHTEQLLWQG